MARAKKETALTPEERLQAALVPDWEWPYKLPENWCWTNWGKCGKFIAGSGFKNEYQGFTNYDIPFYKVSSLKIANETGYLYDNTNTIDEAVRKKLKAVLIPTNSLLFAKIGEAIRLNRRAINTVPCCIDNNMMAFVPQICQLKYAFYWSKGIDLYDFTNATTVPAIRKTDLEKIPFPLAPFAEQQRIVDRIESLFAKLDEAKEKAQAVVDSFETRKAAILHKAFTGELTAKWRRTHGLSLDTWKEVAADSLFEYVTSGSRGWAKYYDESGAAFIRMGNLDHGTIELDLSDIQHVKLPDKAEGQRSRIRKNDILISITADVGMVGLVRNDDFEGYINQHIALVRPSIGENAEFIAWYLVSDVGLKQMQERQRGATKVGLGLNDIRTLRFKIPLTDEQNEILKILKKWLDKEQHAKEAAEAVLNQIDLMKKSILARAFRGELGTNDPSEESAVELIKQIKQDSLGKISGDTLEKKQVKKKVEVGLVAKSIMQALSAGAKLTPENLKAETALPIDDFYDQLKILINGGHVIETRIGGESYLEAKDEDR